MDAVTARNLLSYDPETGLFRWRESRGRVKAGQVAGTLDPTGYVIIRIDGQNHRAHRLAWLHVTGQWPPELIDHIDRDRKNNRWSNIRLADALQNQHNKTPPQRLLPTGVTITGSGKFGARIKINRKQRHLGSFDTAEAASIAYRAAATEAFGPYFGG